MARGRQSGQEGPFTPSQIAPLVYESFVGGLNTNSTRPGIEDNESFWLDGFMPVGPNYLRTMWGIGPAIFIAPSGGNIPFFDFFNIASAPYCLAVHSDGGLWAINTTTLVVTRVAGDGTIESPFRESVGISQWGAKYLLVVAKQTNGYWVWDGTNLYSAGTLGPVVTVDYGGIGYTSQPTMTAVGGHGSGATFSANIQNGGIANITVTNPGVGYQVNDVPIIAFSGGGIPYSTATGVATITSGSIASVSITDPGFGYTTSATVQFLGGTGIGAQGTVTVTGQTVSAVTITNGGQGYAASSPPTIFIQDSNNPVAVAAVAIMPFGIKGSSVETYNAQVWVSDGPNGYFSAPGSVQDFGTPDGGGSFTSTDSFLRVQYTQFRQTNGFLYLIADSSINYISGVTTSGTPASTTFSNQNADPEIGTPYPATIDVFSRNIVFANAFGAHISYGGAVTKISDNLDGVYGTVSNFGGLSLSAAKAIVFGKRIWALLVPIIDPISGQQVNKLFCYAVINRKPVWWATEQDVSLNYVQHQEIASVITAYGTDGNKIYPLFQQPSNAFTKVAQSKLWARPVGYQNEKFAVRLFGLVRYFEATQEALDVSIDSENGSSENSLTNLNPITWVNSSGGVFTWGNSSGGAFTFGGTGVVALEPQPIQQFGTLLGMTISTNAEDMAIISMMIQPEVGNYRG